MGNQLQSNLPLTAGVGFKPEHLQDIQTGSPSDLWFEVHAENYMSKGGPRLQMLDHLRQNYEISVHGVGLSIGGAIPLDQDHLLRLKSVLDRFEPAEFSEHLAWSTHSSGFLNDLLPLPYTDESLNIVADHIDQVQDCLGRRMLLENPSSYLAFDTSTYTETDFLAEIVKRTGCGLLLDVNNVFVSTRNLDLNAETYLRDFPMHAVGEIHLAGHSVETIEEGTVLRIDDHGSEVIDDVWLLYQQVLQDHGAFPTLIEWDTNVPDWNILKKEADCAQNYLNKFCSSSEEVSDVA
ncbi:MAG: DUF692 domain-containing protein [Sneathiellales bacterium]|nr:DUF692 domain-containing protein [Sneathiellales bacterium]